MIILFLNISPMFLFKKIIIQYLLKRFTLWCPKCANFKTEVIGTKVKKENEISRFRICPKCEFEFLTIEIINKSSNREKYKKSLEKLN